MALQLALQPVAADDQVLPLLGQPTQRVVALGEAGGHPSQGVGGVRGDGPLGGLEGLGAQGLGRIRIGRRRARREQQADRRQGPRPTHQLLSTWMLVQTSPRLEMATRILPPVREETVQTG